MQTIPSYRTKRHRRRRRRRGEEKNDEQGVGSEEGEGSRSWRMPQVCPASYPIGLQLDNVLLLVGRFSVTSSTSCAMEALGPLRNGCTFLVASRAWDAIERDTSRRINLATTRSTSLQR